MKNWVLFSLLLAVVLFATTWMSVLGKRFFTKVKTRKAFSILDTQFPASGASLRELLTGIQRLAPHEGIVVFRSLRTQLWVDFIFIFSAYPCIYLLCQLAAQKSASPLSVFFTGLAYAQIIAALSDVTENIFLLSQLKEPGEMSQKMFSSYKVLQILKWGLSLSGLFCALSAALYFWITGNFRESSLLNLLIILAEIMIFILINKLLNKKKESQEI